jgi:hypothetical protein
LWRFATNATNATNATIFEKEDSVLMTIEMTPGS